MKKLILLIPIILLGACVDQNQEIKNNIETTKQKASTNNIETTKVEYFSALNPKFFKKLINQTGTKLVDLRTIQELRQTGIISKNIINIDVYQNNYLEKLKKLDRNKTILLYCRTGHRSGYIKAVLKQLGYKKVYDLSGGIYNWINKGYKTYTFKENKSFTKQEVAKHNKSTDCWTIINNKIYDITSFFGKHPGGDNKLLKICGKDGSIPFNNQHGYNEKAKNILENFYIGNLK